MTIALIHLFTDSPRQHLLSPLSWPLFAPDELVLRGHLFLPILGLPFLETILP